MQLVRTKDLILYVKHRIKFFEESIQSTRSEYKEKQQEHNQTIWHRWFKINYHWPDEFWWSINEDRQLLDEYTELLAKAEYNEKLQQAWTEYDKPGFFNLAKDNNIPF